MFQRLEGMISIGLRLPIPSTSKNMSSKADDSIWTTEFLTYSELKVLTCCGTEVFGFFCRSNINIHDARRDET